MKNKSGWLANTLLSAFLSSTTLSASAKTFEDHTNETDPYNTPQSFDQQSFQELTGMPLYTIQITPSVKLGTDNVDIVSFLHDKLDDIDHDYAVINGIEVPDFIRRPTFFSEVITGTPHGIQINIMSGESNFSETSNAHGSASGFGQFMRNTTIQNAVKISQNRSNDPTISNIQGLFPENIRIAYSKHNNKQLDRLTIINPEKLERLTQAQQKLILNQNEPILNWAKGINDDERLNEKSEDALERLRVINPAAHIIAAQKLNDLHTEFKEKQQSYLEAMNPLSAIPLDELNTRRESTEQALTALSDHKRAIIDTTMDQFTELVHQVEDLALTNELHHAINNNPTITVAQLGLHSSQNIRTLQRNGVPVTEKSTYDAHFSGIGRAITTYKHVQSMPNAPVWKLFGETQEEAEENYGFVMLNPTNRNFYFHPSEEGQDNQYKTIQEYNDYIKQKGFSEKAVKLGDPNALITEAITNGDATLHITNPETLRVYARVEQYAAQVDTIEFMLNNPELAEQQMRDELPLDNEIIIQEADDPKEASITPPEI